MSEVFGGPQADAHASPPPHPGKGSGSGFLSSTLAKVVLVVAVVLVAAIIALVVNGGSGNSPNPRTASKSSSTTSPTLPLPTLPPAKKKTPPPTTATTATTATTEPSTSTSSTTTPTSSSTTVSTIATLVSADSPTVTSVRASSGPGAGGNRVSISGTNFTGATVVMFGKKAVGTFKVNGTGTKISTHAPAQSEATIDVTVVTPKGTSATTDDDHYTFLGPTITKVAPTRGPAGSAMEIFGTDFNGATSVSFGTTSVSTSFSVTSEPHRGIGTEIVAYVPSGGSGTVDIKVTTPGGSTISTTTFTYS